MGQFSEGETSWRGPVGDQGFRNRREVGGRTTTGVRLLSGKEREEEISRLLAGARVTDTTRRQARELLRAVHAA